MSIPVLRDALPNRSAINLAIYIRPAAVLILTTCGIAQLFIEFDLVQLTCALLATVTSILTMAYVLDFRRFRAHPLSMTTVLGYNLSALSVALLTQTMSLRSLTYNLEVPLETFSAIVAVQLLAIAVHWVYARSLMFNSLRGYLSDRLFAPLGLLTPPSNSQLWIMGFVGCVALWSTGVSLHDQIKFGDVGFKFVEGLKPFLIAPFLIPFSSVIYRDPTRRVSATAVGAYFFLVLFIAIVVNARTIFSSAITTVLLICLLSVLCGRTVVSPRKVILTLGLIVGLIPVFSVLSDLAMAMIVARSLRSTVSPIELIQPTIDAFFDSSALEYERIIDNAISGEAYTETYISNPIISRFVATKYIDISMTAALKLLPEQIDEARQMFWTRLAQLPTPILKAIAPDVDKNDLVFSSGDFYAYLTLGIPKRGQKTGYSIGDGWAIMGILYGPFLVFWMLIEFVLLDSLIRYNARKADVFSTVPLLYLWWLFLWGIGNESVATQISQIARDLPQMIVLYLLVLAFSRVVLFFVTGWRLRRSVSELYRRKS